MKRLGAAATSAAVIILSGTGGAYAADLDMTTKAPVWKAVAGTTTCTSIVDFFTTACQVSWAGVRFYGTVDIGFGYQTNGAGLGRNFGPGVDYFIGKNSQGGRWLLAPNALSQSNVGFQIKEPLGAGWSFVGQVETQFDPYTMNLGSSAGSVPTNAHLPLTAQNSYGDGSSQGTFYNGLGFAGFSNDTWGTVTFLRQQTLMGDAVNSYDPMGSSYAFSMLGFFGSWAGGGDTQDRRGTTSVKYRVNFANYHFGVYGQFGGYDEGNASKGAIQGDVGADFNVGPGVFSADVLGSFTKDAVSLTDIGPTNAFGSPINTSTAATTFAATISNNTSVMVAAKYAVDRLTLYAGYEWMQFANPSDAVTSFTDISGAFLCSGTCGTQLGTSINNAAFAQDKILQLAWFGAKYSLTDSLDLIGAYYHENQNNFSAGAANNACALSSTALSSCAGNQDAVSFLIDYKFAPKWDTYIGTLYSKQTGGLDNGFLVNNNWATTAGLRFRW
jgi:predicted porin